MVHIAFCCDVTSVCAYVTLVTKSQFTFKFTCIFTFTFTSKLLITFDTFYVTKLKFGMIFTKTKTLDQGRVVPGACPWMGPGVRMYNRSY